MDDQKLMFFIRIAETGSISAAAKQLNMSQPPLTRQLQLLEAEVGHALFERTHSGVTLTPAGQVFYRYALEWTDNHRAMLRALNSIHDNETHALHLGVDHLAIESSFLDATLDYLRNDPRVHLTLSQKHVARLIGDLQHGTLDAVIARIPYQASNFNVFSSKPEPFVAFGKSHFFKGIKSDVLQADDLRLLPQVNCALLEQKNAFFHIREANTFDRLYIMNSASFTLITLACRGFGVVFVPHSQVRNINQDGFEVRPIDPSIMVSRVDLLWDGANRNPALQNLLAALQTHA